MTNNYGKFYLRFQKDRTVLKANMKFGISLLITSA